MHLSESRLLEMHRIAQMRGIALHRHHIEQLNRELDRRGSMSMDDLFDRFRELGARMSFAQERGLRRWLDEIEATRQHQMNLDIERTRRAMQRPSIDDDDDTGRTAYHALPPYRPKWHPRHYKGAALKALLARDVDERGKMRGPVLENQNGLIREDW